MHKNLWRRAALMALALFALIQLVPYGRNHANPPTEMEPPWNPSSTRDLIKRACFDCHSNNTVWPWYANIAPVSWLVQHDVDEAREHLNFSEWHRPQEDAVKAAEEVLEGNMPPAQYLLMHPEARLAPEEQAQLVRGLERTFGSITLED